LQRDQRDDESPSQGNAAVAGDPKYQALLDNVSMHLEAARKDVDAVVGVQGSNRGAARNRNANGGALKKLNKR
jgi:hypothetical protein